MKNILKKPWILPLILIVAIAIFVILVKSKSPIEHQNVGYPVKTVEVITLKKLPFRARATAFGNVQPAVELKAKSEVSGKIVYIHPDLEKGASIGKNTVVLKIEPTTFEISLDKSKAGLAGNKSSLTQLEVEEKSTKRALQIAQKKLAVGLKELGRFKSLLAKKVITRSAMDKEEQNVLALRQKVEDYQGKLSAFNSRKAATQAQINQSKSQIDQSQDTLNRTEISLSFDARIGEVSIEKDEFIQAGTTLFEALGTQAVEINAELPAKQFRPLIYGMGQKLSVNGTIDLQNPKNLQSALSKLQLEARVRLVGDTGNLSQWKGKLVRLSESVDPTRDTLTLAVKVNEPYANIIPGKRPPLLKGMYTSVEFFAPAKPTLILPRKAIHQGRVYVATSDNTLAIRSVTIMFAQGDLVIIADDENSNIKTGEKIIVSDVIPVLEGLPLKVIQATDYEKQIEQKAMANVTDNK